jgi:hypothetical protein
LDLAFDSGWMHEGKIFKFAQRHLAEQLRWCATSHCLLQEHQLVESHLSGLDKRRIGKAVCVYRSIAELPAGMFEVSFHQYMFQLVDVLAVTV